MIRRYKDRTARKRHECDICPTLIEKGQVYRYSETNDPDVVELEGRMVWSQRLCLDCAAAYKWDSYTVKV